MSNYTFWINEYRIRRATLDDEWQAEMLPLINDMYWHPFRDGVRNAPEDPAELRAWLSDKYDDAVVLALLMQLLQRRSRDAYKLGGETALRFLGYRNEFELSNAEIQQQIDAFAMALVSQGTEYSIVDTTIDDLVAALPAARESENNTLLVLAAYIAMRAAQRNEMIERSERPRWVANAQDETYSRNDIEYMMYDVAGVGCPRICAPWHGTVTRGGAQTIRLIPQHPHCDCIWTPVRYDGEVLGSPPVVVSAPGLPQWQAPVEPWTGE